MMSIFSKWYFFFSGITILSIIKTVAKVICWMAQGLFSRIELVLNADESTVFIRNEALSFNIPDLGPRRLQAKNSHNPETFEAEMFDFPIRKSITVRHINRHGVESHDLDLSHDIASNFQQTVKGIIDPVCLKHESSDLLTTPISSQLNQIAPTSQSRTRHHESLQKDVVSSKSATETSGAKTINGSDESPIFIRNSFRQIVKAKLNEQESEENKIPESDSSNVSTKDERILKASEVDSGEYFDCLPTVNQNALQCDCKGHYNQSEYELPNSGNSSKSIEQGVVKTNKEIKLNSTNGAYSLPCLKKAKDEDVTKSFQKSIRSPNFKDKQVHFEASKAKHIEESVVSFNPAAAEIKCDNTSTNKNRFQDEVRSLSELENTDKEKENATLNHPPKPIQDSRKLSKSEEKRKAHKIAFKIDSDNYIKYLKKIYPFLEIIDYEMNALCKLHINRSLINENSLFILQTAFQEISTVSRELNARRYHTLVKLYLTKLRTIIHMFIVDVEVSVEKLNSKTFSFYQEKYALMLDGIKSILFNVSTDAIALKNQFTKPRDKSKQTKRKRLSN